METDDELDKIQDFVESTDVLHVKNIAIEKRLLGDTKVVLYSERGTNCFRCEDSKDADNVINGLISAARNNADFVLQALVDYRKNRLNPFQETVLLEMDLVPPSEEIYARAIKSLEFLRDQIGENAEWTL